MDKTTRNALLITAGLILVTKRIGAGTSYIEVLRSFLPSVEGFSETPEWDYKQWSWGYGSRVPGSVNDPSVRPPGTITRAKAWDAALPFISDSYRYLAPKLTTTLSGNEWATLLSFAYNTGPGKAVNLIPFINAKNEAGLFAKMRQYVYAGGVINTGLKNRREKEINLWNGNQARMEDITDPVHIHRDLVGDYAY